MFGFIELYVFFVCTGNT